MEWEIRMIELALMHGIILGSSFFLAQRFFICRSYAFLIYLSVIVGLQTLLGIFRVLTFQNLLFLVILFGLFSIFIGRKNAKKTLPSHSTEWNWWPVIIFAPLGAIALVEFFNALIQPVWEYDSLAYHLPFVRHWLTTNSIDVLFTPYTGPVGYYPGSGELLTLWNILPLGHDIFANIQNFPLLIFFAIAAFDLARLLGISKNLSLLPPALFLYSPLILKELGTPHVDLFFALALLYVILSSFDYLKTKNQHFLILIFLALGLFVGSKYLALPYAVLIGVPIILIAAFSRKQNFFGVMSIGILGFFLVGGVWYVRNFFLTGNPIFPAEVRIGPFTIFEGLGDMTKQIMGWSLLKNIDTLSEIKRFIITYVTRTGWQILLLIPAICGGAALFFARKNSRKQIAAFFISLVIFFFLYFAAPYTFNDLDANIRYSLPFLIIASLFIAYIAEHLRSLRFFLVIGVMVTLAVTLQQTFTTPDLPHEIFNLSLAKTFFGAFLFFLSKILVGVFLVIIIFQYAKKTQLRWLLISFLLPIIFLTGNSKIIGIREEQRFAVLEKKYPHMKELIHAFSWTALNVKPNNTIAYSGFHFHSPLFGSKLEQQVRYININACTDCQYHDFKNKQDGIFAGADREAWLLNLEKKNVKYILLFDQIGFLTYEPLWVKGLPEKFQLVFQEGKAQIYQRIY